MKDRLTSGTHKASALVATVLVLAGGARLAQAGEPTDASRDASVDTPPEAAPIAAQPAPAAVPTAEPTLASFPAQTTSALPPGATPPTEVTGAAWFARPRLALAVGQGSRAFKLRFFGFLEADYMVDTTRSYDDSMGTLLVARTAAHRDPSSVA